MNRWAARIMGLLLLIAVLLVFSHMQKTLEALQQQRRPATHAR